MKKIKLTSILLVGSTALLIAVVLLVINYARSADFVIQPPQNLTARSTEDGNKISWTESDYATSYRVYRRGIEGEWQQIAILPSSKQSYVDMDSPKSMCQYGVKAYHKSFFAVETLSEMSDTATIGSDDLIMEVPKFTAVRTANGVEFTWSKVDYATSYQIFHRAAGEDWTLLKAFGATQFSYTGEYEGDNIEYTIRSCSNLTGEFQKSAFAQAIRPE